MRLLHIQVKNYRIHRDTSAPLDDNLVLIHGHNESGKSTLTEAMHCALFLKAKGTTEMHDRMQSNFGGVPEVRLEFKTGDRCHVLHKFFGNKGNTTLESEGQATLTGDAAEEQLARILGVDAAVGGRGAAASLAQRWAHLWVWQGKSTHSPMRAVAESQNQLREKLQSQAGQNIVSSLADTAIIDNLQALVDATFTKTGQISTSSLLHKAEQEVTSVRTSMASKQEVLQSLRQAADAYEQAIDDQQRHQQNLEYAESRLKEIRQKLVTVNEHKARLADKSRERISIEKELKACTDNDTQIRRLETELEQARKTATPTQNNLQALEEEVRSQKITLEEASLARESAASALSRLRAIADAWQAHRSALAEARQVSDLEAAKKKITQLQTEEKRLSQKLAPLADFTLNAIKKLRSSAQSLDQAQARLDAYSLSIELIESNQDVVLDNQALTPGQARTLSHTAELQIGTGTRIRLRPGGAEDLQAAQLAVQKAKDALNNALDKLAVTSLEAAEEKQQQRDALERQHQDILNKLEASEADSIDKKLREASESFAKESARRDARMAGMDSVTFPDDLKTAEQAHSKATETLSEADAASETAANTEKSARSILNKAEKEIAKARAGFQQQVEMQRDLEAALKVHKQQSGESNKRAEAIHYLTAKRDLSLAAERAEQEALNKLGVDQLELDSQRLEKSLITDRKQLSEAQERKITAQTELKSNGSQDPEREYKEAAARCEQLEKRHQLLKHQAKIRLHLLDRLKAARQATTAALAKPLEQAVTPYLQLLLGSGQPRLHWEEDGSCLKSFEIDRTQNHQGLHDFDELSHGTREQVALALRLAMAEILAADHNNCLPLVLDDAFTHADRSRIENLKTLLYRAATQQGLQIILLTCHPENYQGLSAQEVKLPSWG